MVLKEPKEFKGSKEFREYKVILVTLVTPDTQVTLEKLELQDTPDTLDIQVQPDHKELPELLERYFHLVLAIPIICIGTTRRLHILRLQEVLFILVPMLVLSIMVYILSL
jgi:hypothetical protein